MSNPATAAIRAGEILKRLPAGPCSAVELGVFVGVMSEILLAGHDDLHLIAVDSWAEGAVQPEAYKATDDIHAVLSAGQQQKFMRETQRRLARFGTRATILRMDSAEAARTCPDGSVDHVFVDARHDYEGVAQDIEAWAPKVKPGGWMGFHDFEHPYYTRFGVTRAVEEFCLARGLEIERGDNLTAFVRMGGR